MECGIGMVDFIFYITFSALNIIFHAGIPLTYFALFFIAYFP